MFSGVVNRFSCSVGLTRWAWQTRFASFVYARLRIGSSSRAGYTYPSLKVFGSSVASFFSIAFGAEGVCSIGLSG